MKIAIIGASGNAGSAIYQEAVRRGHDVTGFARNVQRAQAVLGAQAKIEARDGFALRREELTQFDAVVDAISAPPAKAYLHVDLAAHLIHELRESTAPTWPSLRVRVVCSIMATPSFRTSLRRRMRTSSSAFRAARQQSLSSCATWTMYAGRRFHLARRSSTAQQPSLCWA